MLAGDPPLPSLPHGEKLWGGDKKWKKVGVGGFQWSITAARERLEEDSKIFTHLLGWRLRRSSQRRLQRKAHINTALRLAVNAHLMKQLRTSAFFCVLMKTDHPEISRHVLLVDARLHLSYCLTTAAPS